MVAVVTASPRTGVVFGGFAAYGALWGPYLSMLPEVQRSTGASAAQLGAALLIGALTSMPAMLAVGRLLDRFGRPVAVATIVVYAAIAVGPSIAFSVPSLIVAVALFGFGSGACNVVVVTLAVTAEAASGQRVLNRAHALFSIGLLACSVGTGLSTAAGVSAQVIAFSLAGFVVLTTLAARDRFPPHMLRRTARPGRRSRPSRFGLVLCLLAGLAMFVESGVQQWSAVFLVTVSAAPAGLAAMAPGVFAGASALARLGTHELARLVPDRWVLVLCGALAGVGTLVLATADSVAVALAGIALVGGAVSVPPPVAYGLAGARANPAERGAVIGTTTSVASVGLLLGPAVVGQIAEQTGLRVAIASLVPFAAVICLVALRMTTRIPRFTVDDGKDTA
jgi:MFS family permease